MTELPSGPVMFLLTDVEGSTRPWDERPAEMQAALERHDGDIAVGDRELRYAFSPAGDGFSSAVG